jgi:predicted nucleotidyltransferase
MKRPVSISEREALREFKQALEALLGDNLLAVRLFGSRARQEGAPESDLDVLVLLREKNTTICRRIVEAALDVDLAYGTNVAPTILTADEYDKNRVCGTPFYRNVEQDAVAL